MSTSDGSLECSSCGFKLQLTVSEVVSYMASGWPLHCGLTMTFASTAPVEVPKAEPKKRKKKS